MISPYPLSLREAPGSGISEALCTPDASGHFTLPILVHFALQAATQGRRYWEKEPATRSPALQGTAAMLVSVVSSAVFRVKAVAEAIIVSRCAYIENDWRCQDIASVLKG
jgi:hypothetical protein